MTTPTDSIESAYTRGVWEAAPYTTRGIGHVAPYNYAGDYFFCTKFCLAVARVQIRAAISKIAVCAATARRSAVG